MGDRPVVYRRHFATEEEADLFYEWLYGAEERREPRVVVSVDRYDGHTISVTFNPEPLEEIAGRIESTYTPPDESTMCKCNHSLGWHDVEHEELDNPCRMPGCECKAFDRADWPGEKGDEEWISLS